MLRSMRLLRAASAAAERGWPVFPVLPYGKRPAIAGWPQQATCEQPRLEAWWRRAPYNVGIACGPARLLVVDLDGPGQPPPEWEGAVDGRDVLARLAGDELQATFTVATPAGGEHRYYTVTAGQAARSTAGTLGWHVDTRGTGGYVVAAGSVRRTTAGRRYYRLADPRPPVPAPRWLLQLLQPPPPAPPVALAPGQRSAYGQAALAGEVALIREAGPGTRNAVVFRAAVKLGTLVAAGVLDKADVTSHLRAAAGIHVGHHGFTAGEADRAIANGLRYGQQHPRRLTDS